MIYTFTTDEHRWLSNMVLVDIDLRGNIFASVEHAYQSEKSKDQKWKEICLNRDVKPTQIKRLSKDITLRPDWDRIKLLVMWDCLNKKFKQEPFRTNLINTRGQNLQEGNYWNDEFWGVNLKKDPNVGENHLGRLIMKIREFL